MPTEFKINYASMMRIKENVRERDGYRCVDCGMTDQEHYDCRKSGLDVHRMIRHTPYNDITCLTVCEPCHATRHRKKRDLRQTKEQAINELTELVMYMADKLAPQYGKAPHDFVDALMWPRRRARLKRLDARFVCEG